MYWAKNAASWSALGCGAAHEPEGDKGIAEKTQGKGDKGKEMKRSITRGKTTEHCGRESGHKSGNLRSAYGKGGGCRSGTIRIRKGRGRTGGRSKEAPGDDPLGENTTGESEGDGRGGWSGRWILREGRNGLGKGKEDTEKKESESPV